MHVKQKKNFISFYNFKLLRINSLILIPKIQQLLLISNGSLTQNLNSLQGNEIKLYLVTQKIKKNNDTIRIVILKDPIIHLVFAISYWKKDTTKISISQPIGQIIITKEIDIFRQISRLNYGYCYNIEKQLLITKAICYRESVMYHQHKYLNLIQEFIALYSLQ